MIALIIVIIFIFGLPLLILWNLNRRHDDQVALGVGGTGNDLVLKTMEFLQNRTEKLTIENRRLKAEQESRSPEK